jgi:uncharacterized protein with NRDE domain
MSHKGDWNRVSDHEAYGNNYNNIFRKNMDELFKTNEDLSPRKKWMARKSISCSLVDGEWMCYREGTQVFAKAATEEEACMELAIKLKTKSWKE